MPGIERPKAIGTSHFASTAVVGRFSSSKLPTPMKARSSPKNSLLAVHPQVSGKRFRNSFVDPRRARPRWFLKHSQAEHDPATYDWAWLQRPAPIHKRRMHDVPRSGGGGLMFFVVRVFGGAHAARRPRGGDLRRVV